MIDPLNCDLIIEKEKPTIYYKDKYLDYVDAIIPRIGASVTFYGCAVVRQFEMMNVFSTVSSDAIIRSRDKLRSFQHLSKGGIDMPKTVFTNYSKDVEEVIEHVGGTPVVIKLLEGTQGLGDRPRPTGKRLYGARSAPPRGRQGYLRGSNRGNPACPCNPAKHRKPEPGLHPGNH